MIIILQKLLDIYQKTLYTKNAQCHKIQKNGDKVMSGKEDLRVRKTKKALFDAFIKLLSQKSFDEITVNELCDEAGVRRATFYKHYADKFDFLTAYTSLLRDRFDRLIWKDDKPTLTPEYYAEYAKRFIHFMSENSVIVHNLCMSSLFPSVLVIILEQNYKDTCDRLRISVEEEGISLGASIEAVALMCTGGVAACIYNWIKDDNMSDPEVVSEQVGAIIKKIVS